MSTELARTDISVGAQRSWARRRLRYGDHGVSPQGIARLRVAGQRTQHAAALARRNATHCKRGHRFTSTNTYYWPSRRGYRLCRACTIARKRRARSKNSRPIACIAPDGTKIYILPHDRYYHREVQRLKTRMMNAHPDRGGTVRRFERAMQALKQFKAREAAWYAEFNLLPPTAHADDSR